MAETSNGITSETLSTAPSKAQMRVLLSGTTCLPSRVTVP